MDTIVALATAQGRAGVAVVRVSGERAWDVCASIAGIVPEPRRARLVTLRDASGEVIDHALVLVFDEGHSFTGERVCEFQIHGSVAGTKAVLQACLDVPGVRAAEPGEFTKRAFLSGQMDLAEVEGLADLIEAETEAQRRQAFRVFGGEATKAIDGWREGLIQAMAMLEAALDFADEEIPEDLSDLVLAPLDRVLDEIRGQIAGKRAAEAVRDGFEVAIVGRVNAGKSTLLNALAGREAAITSERAGTTRDVIEVRMDIGGLPVTLIDTAGLRDAEDEVEQIGIIRGRQRAEAADIRIFLKAEPDEEPEGIRDEDIVVLSKADLWGQKGISARTGAGIGALLGQIEGRLREVTKGSSIFSRERHFDKLERAAEELSESRAYVLQGTPFWELASEHLRSAVACLDGIVGRVDVEDVLGRIFSSFCIGK
ncbi:MAG: tRNA uridine-5-carboxymethylaminomethyl(34) synthesis GTPase MnmE [Rhodobacteraceae bacterium]|nr:tRNA uridine-5-carboxymethylaminomethyl(34) synthesis GTPase MnmE [Paracoccaceae bacterium]